MPLGGNNAQEASRFAEGVQTDFAFAALEGMQADFAASEGARVLGRAALLRLVLSQARTIRQLRKGQGLPGAPEGEAHQEVKAAAAAAFPGGPAPGRR